MSWAKALLVGLAATLLITSAPGIASATGPEIERFTDSGSFVDTSLCGFPIHVSWQEEGTVYQWFDANGNLVYLKRHEVFSEVARANGKVATGVDRQNFVNDQQGNYVFTGSWIFFLPDGSHIQNAGRLQTTDEGQILSEHGQHPIAEGLLAERFCPPMS
jgi:hypothetical protein